MSKEAVIIKNWPFSKGEKVKLTWIGEPFKHNNKWMVYAYFRSTNNTRRIMLDWASTHFLSVGKYYANGNLNNGETKEDIEIIDINLNGVKPEYRERDWNISGAGFSVQTKSKTFNFYKNGSLYTIPIIEIIRAILAPDKFMLNRILEMDTLENYFIYELNRSNLDIHFTAEYEAKYIKGEKVNHLAWILTNESVLRMFNSIGQGIWEKKELKYDFLLERFNIRARVERKDKFIKVLEIISLYKKKINVEEINVFHPSLEETISSNDPKKRKYVSKNDKGDRELDPDADGSTKDSEGIDTFMLNHEYEREPKIKKKKTGRKVTRNKEDKNTKTYVLDSNNLRTTADTGGENVIRGLEFRNLAEIKEIGELQEFIEVLKLLEERQDVKSVDIIIDNLPEGKRFSKLNDGIRNRKCGIGKIIMVDGRENCLIEVEREDKALSMLVLKSNNQANWKSIYNILIMGLVNESGKWSNSEIEKIKELEITVLRNKHINKNVYEKATHIYEKL
ncbi:Tn7-like element transposition protein TnsE [Clostridium algidicarnis]|uniref:Tn7-like element transposition protein TnsE n=1 Tax=Clostridium algidicarnis TaxID=37659 RepID=UPI00049786C5|nr:Tn7-like element transposition protein TnsE [Clostridium algidicarnis]